MSEQHKPTEVEDKAFDLRNKIDEPHTFIQWKGTEVCMDFHCECGHHSHFDCSFAYCIQCPKCLSFWEMPSHLFPRKIERPTYGRAATTILEDNEDE